MFFDGIIDVGADRFSKIISEGGPTFPLNPLTGQLFAHDTHGLCVYCHDGIWRTLLMPYMGGDYVSR